MTGDEHPTSDRLVGRLVMGRYRVVRRLARGGMGVVYLARTEGAAGFVRAVVVKRVIPTLAHERDLMAMFVREARVLSRLRHPNIVSVIDLGRDEDAYAMVLEYVAGYDLGKWARWVWSTQPPMPVHLAVFIVGEVLRALAHAHELRGPDGSTASIVHRDVSPGNVMLDTDGHVRLTDFGIAKSTLDTSGYQTETISVKGKFPYMAPELLGGEPATIASDLYASGVMLRELLLGYNEFKGADPAATVRRVVDHVPAPLSTLRPDIPPELGDLCDRVIAKDMSRRPSSADALRRALVTVRGVEEEVARSDLVRRLRRDFAGPLPQALALPGLDELEAAWQGDVVPAGEDGDATAPKVAKGRGLGARRKRRRSVVAALAVLLAAASGAGYALWRSAQPAPEPARYIVVEGTPASPEDGSPEAGDDEIAAVEDGEELSRADGEEAPLVPPSSSLSARLRRAVSARMPAFERCLADAEWDGTIVLRFALRPDGSVEQLEVRPSQFGSSAGGACVQRVARTVRFPRVPRAVTFRVPLERS